MALSNIIEALNRDAAEEIALIAAERDTEIARITADYETYVAKHTAETAHDRERRSSKVAERILAKARHQANFITTGAIEKELEAVFSTAKTELLSIDTPTYLNFLEKQWQGLTPVTNEMSFLVAEERAEVTTDFLIQKGVAPSTIDTLSGLLGGFIVSTDTREFDHSFKGILAQLKTTQAVAISKQLVA